MKTSFYELIKDNDYPGRGIIVGTDESGKFAVSAYFIMGRSENSRNRVFVTDGNNVYTKPFDESKVKDPSLIIYRAVATANGSLVVTNGDQTDTIVKCVEDGKSFEDALFLREYEPDEPNFTPRISAISFFSQGKFEYALSILKKARESDSACERFFYHYPSVAGTGKFIHTYKSNGDPLPSFEGSPKTVAIPADADKFADEIWSGLNEDNKISLYVRYTDIRSGEYKEIVKNKYERRI